MSTLVIKSWKVQSTPIDDRNNFVKIVGRQGGLLSWFLSLMKIDPTTSILIGGERLEFSTSSLAGTEYRLIPLQNICSTYYGYHKPWKAAATIIALSFFMASALAQSAAQASGDPSAGVTPFLAVAGIGGLIALVYYFLNRTLTLGFVEASGVVSGIQFKRSVIENVDVNDVKAREVCQLVQNLIERRQQMLENPLQQAA